VAIMKFIKKNEQQLRFNHGDEVVDAMKEGIKATIKSGQTKTISIDNIDKELERLAKKNK
jgi:hypothetical protein